MVKDLKNNYLKQGITTKEEVLLLLGSGNIWSNLENCRKYSLWMCNGFRMDYHPLYVCVDQQDKVQHVYTIQH